MAHFPRNRETVEHFRHTREAVADFHCNREAQEHSPQKREVADFQRNSHAVANFHRKREAGVVVLVADTLILSCLNHCVSGGSHGGIPFQLEFYKAGDL